MKNTTIMSQDSSPGIEWGDALLAQEHSSRRRVSIYLKRTLDIVLSLMLLIFSIPLLCLTAVLIRLTSPGPAIFIQKRVGKNGAVFGMYKFRTMVNGAHELESELSKTNGDRIFFKVKDDPRVTRLGTLLRKYSLDELPQLFNVLRNDMSLVGPRPLLLSDFDKFPKHRQLRRFSLKPGITGLWQVSGRSELSDNDRIRLDLDYVDGWGFWKDVVILARTLPVVIRARGAY